MYRDNKNITKSTIKEKKNKKKNIPYTTGDTPPTHPLIEITFFFFFSFLRSGNGKLIIGRITPPPPYS